MKSLHKVLIGVGVSIVVLAVIIILATHNWNKKVTDPGPFPNRDDPKIKAFMKYLQTKLQKALLDNMSDKGQLDDPKAAWPPAAQFGIGIYVKNTPGNRGPVKVWSTLCGGVNSTQNACPNTKTEPKFYFGSGTKPITATLVANEVYKVWRKNNPNSSPKDFIDWYGGPAQTRGAPPAVTYKDLFQMTNGFEKSDFREALNGPSDTQSKDSATRTISQRLQDWIFCCPSNGLIKSCPGNTGLFCDNTCDKICPDPLDPSFRKFKGGPTKCAPYCPDSICEWAWKDKNGDPAKLDPNSQPFVSGESCTCETVDETKFQNIIQNLSIYEVGMMRSGIPDADSIWGLDSATQMASRTHSVGPVEFVSEIIGFDWIPGWKKTSNGGWEANTKSLRIPSSNSEIGQGLPPAQIANCTNKNGCMSEKPAAQYSSSAFTFLGVLLWLLSDSKGPRDWRDVDINSLLPIHLQKMMNFAGTSGNGGSKYFTNNIYGEKYYSYYSTVKDGGVAHSVVGGIYGPQETNFEVEKSGMVKVSPQYFWKMRTEANPKGENLRFTDWDAASGLFDGNAWGGCSDMAEIYMNIFSPVADNPIMEKEVHVEYLNAFINYVGPNMVKLYDNKLQAPWCLGAQAWSQGYTYNAGVMGPDWFYFTDNSSDDSGVIPCFGHLGSTWGYTSCNIYVPGTVKTYEPIKNDPGAYSKSYQNWNMTFKFTGGYEFTISCAQNTGLSEAMGPVQKFLWEVIKDPFSWDD